MRNGSKKTRSPVWSPWYFLLLIIYVAVLWVPFYNSIEPTILGFPFFYAYQIIWVLISSLITAIVFFATR